jgi:hypothetical protein
VDQVSISLSNHEATSKLGLPSPRTEISFCTEPYFLPRRNSFTSPKVSLAVVENEMSKSQSRMTPCLDCILACCRYEEREQANQCLGITTDIESRGDPQQCPSWTNCWFYKWILGFAHTPNSSSASENVGSEISTCKNNLKSHTGSSAIPRWMYSTCCQSSPLTKSTWDW